MFCSECGQEVLDTDLFCPSCGERLNKEPADQQTIRMAASSSQPEPEPRPMRVVYPASASRVQTAPPPVGQPYVASMPESYVSAGTSQTASQPEPPHAPESNRLATAAIVVGIVAAIVIIIALVVALVVVPTIGSRKEPAPASSSAAVQQEPPAVSEEKDASEEGAPKAGDSNDYILADSDVRVYSKSELAEMDLYALYLARNEIYARHGRMFNNADLQSYFDGKPWYHATVSASDFDEGVLNETEKKNAEAMLALEQERNSPYLSTTK